MYICILLRVTQVRANDDRAIDSFVRKSYVSTLCPVVICPYLCTSELLYCLSIRGHVILCCFVRDESSIQSWVSRSQANRQLQLLHPIPITFGYFRTQPLENLSAAVNFVHRISESRECTAEWSTSRSAAAKAAWRSLRRAGKVWVRLSDTHSSSGSRGTLVQ